ncbi:MAG: methylated-DNA--[protein]-cysteine S-methyltransferase [Nitrospirae bacterium]|nr:methylated-DNA--[protein]-cysteine S-methyltransferase [Candidatus Manganitrophaceae bacterium]
MKEISQPLFYDITRSPLGLLGRVAHPEGLSYLLRSDTESDLLNEIARRVGALPERHPGRFAPWRRQIDCYFNGQKPEFDAPIFWLTGTLLQRRVWKALTEIPYGEVRSYQWIADRLGLGRGARAVGNACGRNPLPIILPCHRVVHEDGTLGGYTGGIDIKRRLLAIERVYWTQERQERIEAPRSLRRGGFDPRR